jgi:nitrate reductase cytochrome c-type subunit
MRKFSLSLIMLMAAAAFFAQVARADGPGNQDADARFAEGNPPVIPHAVADDATGQECLDCHWPGGKVTAPLTSHPLRVSCTQCHVLSVPAPEPGARKKGRR